MSLSDKAIREQKLLFLQRLAKLLEDQANLREQYPDDSNKWRLADIDAEIDRALDQFNLNLDSSVPK